MARTRKGKERFPFRIILVPEDRPAPKPPWIGSHQWKYRAIYNIKMKLSIQIQKASNRAKWKWYKFYSVRGYGAPGRLEFICPYSGMVAKTLDPLEAASARKYWADCARKSKELLDWVSSLNPMSYSADLNSYLIRLIVVSYNIREVETYQKRNPFTKPKPWQERQSITQG